MVVVVVPVTAGDELRRTRSSCTPVFVEECLPRPLLFGPLPGSSTVVPSPSFCRVGVPRPPLPLLRVGNRLKRRARLNGLGPTTAFLSRCSSFETGAAA